VRHKVRHNVGIGVAQSMPLPNRAQEIVEEMKQLVAESKDLICRNDQIHQEYELLRQELDSIQRISSLKPEE